MTATGIEWGRISYTDPNTNSVTTVIIYAESTKSDSGVEGVSFRIKAIGGDLFGFFLDFEDNLEPKLGTVAVAPGGLTLSQGDDNVLWVGSKANNMNGTASNAEAGALTNDAYDIGLQLSEPGASSGNTESVSFSLYGISLAELDGQRFGIRLQNTLNDEGSLKLEGEFSQPQETCNFAGYSRGSWLNGERKDDLTGLIKNNELGTFETLIFGASNSSLSFESKVNGDTETYEDLTLIEALGLNGGGNNQLAAQATAAYLNALYLEQDADPLTCYQLNTSAIKELTAKALNGEEVNLTGYYWYVESNGISGFQEGDKGMIGGASMTAEDLKNLFDFNNNLSGLSAPLSKPIETNSMVLA